MPQRKQKVSAKGESSSSRRKCENAVAKTEEVERMCKGNIISDSVVTANENDGWHRGRAILSAASEDEVHIAFNNDHFTKRSEITDSETTPFIAAETAEVAGEEHLERSTMNDDVAARRRQMKLVGDMVDILYSVQ